MSLIGTYIKLAVATLCAGLMPAAFSQGRIAAPQDNQPTDRARILLSRPLAKMDGEHLKVLLVEVKYGPGEASSPHSHPCAVVGYVAEGVLRSQVQGEPEKIYKTGESFYEAPKGVHLVSANASSTEPAKLMAYLICDHDTPLSVTFPEKPNAKESSK
jgi:quercetin dioxygenase-like cupin family protein